MLQLILKRWRVLFVLGLILSSFFIGYKYSSYKNDSEQLSELSNQQKIMQEWLSRESSVAEVVEHKLSELKANERVLERERVRIVEKPVYNIQCLDEDGLELLRRYAGGVSE